MREMVKLHAWDVDRDRRWVQLEGPAYNGEGEDLMLFNGAPVAEDTVINLVMPPRGELPDFLNGPGALLYVSARAETVVTQASVPSLRKHRLVLRDQRGRAIRDDYFWLNVVCGARLLDDARSRVSRTASGGIRSVDRLVIRHDHVPGEDLFILHELSIPVMTDRLKLAIEDAGLSGATFEDLETLTWPV